MQLHYDTHGEGEPLLWLHGGMGHGPDWQYIFKEPPAGYRLIAPDLRGHGRSTGASATYSFKQSALDVFALLDHLKIDRVKVIGLSGGGITALHMATIQPEREAAMVVISAPAAFPEQARAIQRIFSEAMLGDAERALMRQRHQREGQLETLFAQVHAFADGDDPGFTPGAARDDHRRYLDRVRRSRPAVPGVAGGRPAARDSTIVVMGRAKRRARSRVRWRRAAVCRDRPGVPRRGVSSIADPASCLAAR